MPARSLVVEHPEPRGRRCRRPCRRGRTGSPGSSRPGRARLASRSAPASACALSIAGMMPSVRHSSCERVHRLGVGDRLVAWPGRCRAARRARPDARVVQAGRDRVRLDGLAVLVLQQVGAGAVQHADGAAGDAGRVPAGVDAVAAGLEAEQRAPSASGMKAWKMPIALEPPPTQAHDRVGQPAGQRRGTAPAPRRRCRGRSRAPSPGTGAGRPTVPSR